MHLIVSWRDFCDFHSLGTNKEYLVNKDTFHHNFAIYRPRVFVGFDFSSGYCKVEDRISVFQI